MTALSLVVAHDRNRLIGLDGDLPWRLPDDLKHFKALTLGHIVLMGRKTWDSLPRKPLPGRENWVMSRDASLQLPEARVFTSLDAAIAAAEGRELMVIGGAQLYALALPRAQRIHLTEVLASVPAEGEAAYFPTYDAAAFRTLSCEEHAADERHAHAYRFLTLERP